MALCLVWSCGRSHAAHGGSSLTAQAFVADSCARDENGAVWCWSQGFGAAPSTPTRIKELEGAASVVAGPVFTYIVKTDGSVWTYGVAQDPGGSAVRHDQKIYKDVSVPERFEPLTSVIAMSANVFGLALRANGELFSWKEEYTRKANDEYDGYKRTAPVLVGSLPKSKALDGWYAVAQGGRVFYVGFEADGETPRPIWIPEVSAAIQVISCPGIVIDACARTESGAIQCWKRARDTGKITLAPPVAGLPAAARIACQNDKLYVIDGIGDVYAWDFAGINGRSQAVHAQNLRHVRDIQPHEGHVTRPHCLIDESSAVSCWASQHRLGTGDWVSWQAGSEGRPFSATTEPILKGVDLRQMHPSNSAAAPGLGP